MTSPPLVEREPHRRARLELAHAMESCVWASPAAGPARFTETWVRERTAPPSGRAPPIDRQ